MSQRFSPGGFSSNKESSVLLIAGPPGDDSRFAEMLHESRRDATLRRVHGLERGRAALREEAPDVVIVDLDLPDQDGTTAIAHCAAAAPPVPIVALTSSDAMPSAQSIEEAGAAECLRKDHLTPALIGKTLRWVQERRQMQDTIRKQNAWFRSMTDNVSEGVFRAGPTGRIEYANEAFAALFGYERGEEMQGIDFTTLYANPEQRGRMMAGEGAERAELSFRRPDGTTFTGLLNATAARDPNGKIQHFDGVLVDIDARKERERKLRVLSGAVEQANEAVLITNSASPDDPGRRIVFVNDAFEEMTGYSEAEVLGETPRILQGPETDQAVLDSLQEVLESGEQWEGEAVNYRKDGTPFYVQWNVAPVRNEEGDIEHWVSIQRDVTDRRRREETLREQEARLRGLAHSIPGVTYRLRPRPNASHQFQFVSERAEELLGISSRPDGFFERLVQRVPAGYQEKLLIQIEEAVEQEESWSLELPFEKPSGERLWLYSAATPERVGNDLTFSGVLLDTTKRRQLERKVIAISDEERRRIGEDLHDVLASSLAGTSMVVRSAATSLEKGNGLSADRLHEAADRIEEASEQARSLSQSLTPLEIQGGGLTEGLRNMADRQERMSEISCSFEATGHAELSEDVAAHLYRMGAEAVHNAIRHADPTRVEIRLQFEDDQLVLSVQDDGKGIPEEIEPSETYGLQLMQYRADLIGAHLDIGSLEEGGTLVRCRLPLENVVLESSDPER